MKIMPLLTLVLAGLLVQVIMVSNPLVAQEGPRRPEPRENRESGEHGDRDHAERAEGEARDRDRDADRDQDRERERDQVGQREREEEIRRMRVRLEDLIEAGEEREAGELKRHIVELKGHGRFDEAERMERQVERQGPEHPEMHREGPQNHGDIGEVHRRLHHLTVAIEHLRVGGFHEPAQDLEREGERIRGELTHRNPEGQRGRGGPGGRDEGVRPGFGSGRGPGRGPGFGPDGRAGMGGGDGFRGPGGPGGSGRSGPGFGGGPRNEVRRGEGGPMVELRELRESMGEMRSRMAEMSRAIEELREQVKRR